MHWPYDQHFQLECICVRIPCMRFSCTVLPAQWRLEALMTRLHPFAERDLQVECLMQGVAEEGMRCDPSHAVVAACE